MKLCKIKGCQTGRNSIEQKKLNLRNLSVFKVPKQKELLQKWQALYPYLTKYDAVCELHFYKNDVIKEDVTVLPDGSVCRIPRIRSALKPNACPVIKNGENRHLKHVEEVNETSLPPRPEQTQVLASKNLEKSFQGFVEALITDASSFLKPFNELLATSANVENSSVGCVHNNATVEIRKEVAKKKTKHEEKKKSQQQTDSTMITKEMHTQNTFRDDYLSRCSYDTQSSEERVRSPSCSSTCDTEEENILITMEEKYDPLGSPESSFVINADQKNILTPMEENEDPAETPVSSSFVLDHPNRPPPTNLENASLQFLKENQLADLEMKRKQLEMEERKLEIRKREVALQEKKVEQESKEREQLLTIIREQQELIKRLLEK